jgi:hypothetical protein
MPITAEPTLEIVAPEAVDQAGPSTGNTSSRGSLAVLLVVWVLSLIWLGAFLRDNWVPHDEGMLAQSAERVLQGQLPHRDFDEVYTGGLSYLHAAAFKLFGTNLFSLRLMLFAFFLLWVPVLYYCASRFAGPLGAGLATLLGVAWSVPVYPASMPSWYCLFFATFGVAALFKYLETRARGWLFAGGLCGGLSFLVKSPGLYFIAAALLFFLYREQSQARLDDETHPSSSHLPGRFYPLFARICIFTFIISVVLLIRHLADLPEIYAFVVPALALGLALLARESRPALCADGTRFRNLFRLAVPFLAGAALPVALFLIPYVMSHSLGSFYNGVFVVPRLRIGMAVYLPPRLGALITLVPGVALFAFACFSKRRESPVVGAAVFAGFVAVLVASPHSNSVYRLAWFSAATVIPVIIVAGALVVFRGGAGWRLDELRRQQIFLIISATALCSLIQFPYSSPTYFFFVAPLAVLAALAILSAWDPRPRLLPALVAGFYMAFVMIVITPGFGLDGIDRWYRPAQPVEALGIPRAGILRVHPDDAETYRKVVSIVQAKAANGALYAGPDCPEIYFLTGLKNPTRMIFDGFEDYAHENDRVLGAIDATNPSVIVIDRLPYVSTPFSEDLREALAARFPEMAYIGKFEVRWRP